MKHNPTLHRPLITRGWSIPLSRPLPSILGTRQSTGKRRAAVLITRNMVLGRPHSLRHVFTLATILAPVPNVLVAAAFGNSDVLTRCENLPSNTSVLRVPTTASLPRDVAATLAAHSNRTWDELKDGTKVGLLWVHGYVFSDGLKRREDARDAVVQVYTRCAPDTSTGIAMTHIGLSSTEVDPHCDAVPCGSNDPTPLDPLCVANLTKAIQCAIHGASTPGQVETTTLSFWSSAWSTSTLPYPQALEHRIPLQGQPNALNMYSIHMRDPDARRVPPDAIIPCLRLEDVTTSATGVSGFCKPAVNVRRVKRFLDSTRTKPLRAHADATRLSSFNGHKAVGMLGMGLGGTLLLVLLAWTLSCRCRDKTRLQTATPPPPTFQGQRPTLVMIQATQRPMSNVPERRGKNRTNNSTNNVHRRSTRSRRSSWYTLNHTSHGESTRNGRWSSFFAGTWLRAGAGGKTASEYCNESQALTEFTTDPTILTKRIAYDQLTFVRILSSGASGEVWLGQLQTQQVAIKRLLPEKCQLTSNVEQFAREIELMCMLQHRNIVSFVGMGWNRLQNLCAVVEYMDAGDLAKVLKTHRDTFSWYREKISIAMEVAESLVYLHNMKPAIVHRDLKSKNVLLNRHFHAKLSDFGVSRTAQMNETMTSGIGTLLWTAPEIIEGKKYSEKADVYSLGVVLSELDTCELPFSDVTSPNGERLPGMQVAQLVRLEKIRVTLRKDCPPSLRQLILECTQLDPDARPSSMQVAFTLKSMIAPMLRTYASMRTSALTSSSVSESRRDPRHL